jgi:ankyrin repeat protein
MSAEALVGDGGDSAATASHSALYNACLAGEWGTTNDFLHQGADPSWNHPESGKSVVHLAAETGHLEALMDFCAIHPGNASIRDSFGETPLHKAAC